MCILIVILSNHWPIHYPCIKDSIKNFAKINKRKLKIHKWTKKIDYYHKKKLLGK